MYTIATTPPLRSMDHVRVNALVAILASASVLKPRYEALTTLFLSVTISHASTVILCTAYSVTNALPFFTLVKPVGASGVVLANTYIVSATTLLGALWPNISTPRVTVLQISECAVCSYAWDKPPAQAARNEVDFPTWNCSAGWT